MPVGPRPKPPIHTARVSVEGYWPATGHPAANVFHVYMPGETASLEDLSSFLDDFANSYETRFLTHLHNTYSTQRARVTLRTGASTQLALDQGRAATGSIGGSLTPQQVSAVISWIAVESYRGGHGRTYLPAIPFSALGGSETLLGAFTGDIAAAAVGFLGDVNALNYGTIPDVVLGEVHFQSSDEWLSPPTFEPFLGAIVRNLIRTQRRRVEF
jgi:hypothetical protein